MFITHDLGVIARVADRVQAMYAGRAAEIGAADDMFDRPRHPYTHGLPSVDGPAVAEVAPQPDRGITADDALPAVRCAFHPRCPWRKTSARTKPPLVPIGGPAVSACYFADEEEWQ